MFLKIQIETKTHINVQKIILKKLAPNELNNFNIETLLKNTEPKEYEVIGQNKATSALQFGLFMDKKGYNIYVSGGTGFGKKTAAIKYAEEIAKKRPTPPDLCYTYNFENPKSPKLLKLTPGLGKVLKKDMKDLIEDLITTLTSVVKSDEHEEAKEKIIKKFEEKRELLVDLISEKAKNQNFEVKQTGAGVYFLPIIEGKAVSEEDFGELEEEAQQKILEESKLLKKSLAPIMGKIKSFEAEIRKNLTELEYQKLLFELGNAFSDLFIKYEEHEQIILYLKEVKEDILQNLDLFLEEVEQAEDEMQMLMPWIAKKDTDSLFERYKINVLVDNSELSHAPVVFLHSVGYKDIIGEIEHDTEYGNYVTDLMKIRAGALHKANGGYLVLYIQDINYLALDALFTALKKEKLTVEPIREFQTIALNLINPEPLDLDVKVILLGDYYIYDILSYDDDFKKLFKIRVEFDYEMDFENNISEILAFINDNAKQAFGAFASQAAPCLTDEAKIEFIRFLMRESGKKTKLTTDFGLAKEILEEACAWAKIEESTTVTAEILEKTLTARNNRHNLYEEKLNEMIEEGTILLDVKGKQVGQINGLAVLDTGDYSFAKPSKITATCYAGNEGIINIEKESKLSGKIHDKGTHILTGYLGSTYAKENPISVSISIAFEQNYSGIDGDSASTTEAYAIISAISEIPLSQELAVTGSMNQFGHIQPIGGVTEKIEGFFDTCKRLGLTGNQGVLIPHTNVNELMLKEEVIKAVAENRFHIYAIKHVEEGLELLMDMKIDEINAKVNEKLKKYNEMKKEGKIKEKE